MRIPGIGRCLFRIPLRSVGPMEINVRKDQYFVEDDRWHRLQHAHHHPFPLRADGRLLPGCTPPPHQQRLPRLSDTGNHAFHRPRNHIVNQAEKFEFIGRQLAPRSNRWTFVQENAPNLCAKVQAVDPHAIFTDAWLERAVELVRYREI